MRASGEGSSAKDRRRAAPPDPAHPSRARPLAGDYPRIARDAAAMSRLAIATNRLTSRPLYAMAKRRSRLDQATPSPRRRTPPSPLAPRPAAASGAHETH
ncbi:hypothetical protein WS83_19615 [Burkholderia sp. MSMB2042]|nr:hypothetical protein WS78_14775 [Burkholderia savannae]KVG41276.1 hypothetical protein WS77_00680 [Burkholderia sp. MSMB0265]KVG84463.1 hypothetical protein WS81_06245 [Burkholderia sp. MSMB2040]KVG95576.1 hypothetical protein WS82_04930 [Burkholderia sp. MSMB2041]KVH01268.1 hypothetical protein WS83_19615 [Burkholderia sp. MSMB2042]